MRFLTPDEVIRLHEAVIEEHGGLLGIRNLAGLESALAQPGMTFGSADLYPTIIEKAAALAFSLVANHPFHDGNKRTGHAALETFLVLNGFVLTASNEEQENIFLQLASGQMKRDQFVEWIQSRIKNKELIEG